MFVQRTGDVYDPDTYSETDFYTLETGESRLQIRIPDKMSYQIKHLVNCDELPHYHTGTDFLRDAVVHRMHQLSRIITDPKVVMELQDAAMSWTRRVEAQRAIDEMKMFDELIRDMETMFRTASPAWRKTLVARAADLLKDEDQLGDWHRSVLTNIATSH